MEMEIRKERENKLLKRKEIEVYLDHTGKPTPTRLEILKELAKKLKVKEDLIIVDKIFSETGKACSRVKVLVYQNTKDIPPGKIEKMKRRMAKAKKPEEKPKEEAKVEEGVKEEEKIEEEKPKPEEEPKKEEVVEETEKVEEKPETEEEAKPEETEPEKKEEKTEEKETKE